MSESQFVTIEKGDPRFVPYLIGTFSKTLRAIPIQTLNLGEPHETITFELVAKDKITKPHFLRLWLQVFKIHHLVLVLFPIFLVLIKLTLDENAFDPGMALSSIMAVIFLMTAVNLRNDYRDHMLGYDRVSPESGSRAIQLGWITAAQCRNWSFVHFFLGGVFGLPAVFAVPDVLFFVALGALFFILGLISTQAGLKHRHWMEVSAFFLLGPLLTIGFQISVGMGFDLESLFLGVLTGAFAVFQLHLKNFSQLLDNFMGKQKNLISQFGFEKGRRFLFAWWSGWITLLCLYHWIYGSRFWAGLFVIAAILLTHLVLKWLTKLQSPLGSGLRHGLSQIARISYLAIALWTFILLSYLLVHEIHS